jgi:hypothetical protein
MKSDSDRHFKGVQQIIPSAKRLVLFDYDEESTFHPDANNPVLYEWGRKNIENYLLVTDAWERAALQKVGITDQENFSTPIEDLIREFFAGENLTLPPSQCWREVKASIFKVVNGKKILFENPDSLFQVLKAYQSPIASFPALELTREMVAVNMLADEIHEDVHRFFDKLGQLLQ